MNSSSSFTADFSNSNFEFDREKYIEFVRQESRERETTVYSSIFSRDGNYLICGTSFGMINVWNIQTFLSPEFWKQPRPNVEPQLSFQAHAGSIYNLAFSETTLFSAGEESIKGWNWKQLESATSARRSLSPVLELPNPRKSLVSKISIYEISGIVVDHKNPSILYAACGNNNAYAWDVTRQQVIGTFKGHKNYLHCITQRPNLQVVTGSEDGDVRLWDPRTFQSVKVLSSPSTKSPNWIGCVAVDKNDLWLVSGGGARYLTVWHLPSSIATSYMPTPGQPQAVSFGPDDQVISVGNEPFVYHWKNTGKFVMRVPATSRSLFSIAINEPQDKRLLAVSGASPFIDIYTNFGNIAFSLRAK